ncbi:unnamed protein product [Nippostrongylus brasiliensis]|uniref:Uncharacterized protein n=1 Tax=Nippostrongylus brasiliensis TaxID=27835 RepID=A0A0N4XT95_NIPBR|nr:unnamed protein product [Nippostrongylus brasiliensis]
MPEHRDGSRSLAASQPVLRLALTHTHRPPQANITCGSQIFTDNNAGSEGEHGVSLFKEIHCMLSECVLTQLITI